MFDRPPPHETSKIIEGQEVLGFSKLEIVGHARIQMKTREITVPDVIHTLNFPDVTGLTTQPGRSRVRWNKSARSAIDVVYETRSDRILVITAIKKTRPIVDRG